MDQHPARRFAGRGAGAAARCGCDAGLRAWAQFHQALDEYDGAFGRVAEFDGLGQVVAAYVLPDEFMPVCLEYLPRTFAQGRLVMQAGQGSHGRLDAHYL